MKILKFRLEGKTGIFKMPDINTIGSTSLALTFNNIHKTALIGMFGNIIGYDGYNQQKKKDAYPEYYEKLIGLKVGITPLNPFPKKSLHTFVNQTGHASNMTKNGVKGGVTLIYKEQWIENPAWMIYVQVEDDNEASVLLSEAIIKIQSFYTPYLGKSNHLATIKDVEIIEGKPASMPCTINSLVFMSTLKNMKSSGGSYYIQESLPVRLDEVNNNYEYEKFVFSDQQLSLSDANAVTDVQGENIFFF